MWRACALGAALILSGCGKTTEQALRDVQPPKVVTKVVETYRPLPDWATEELPNQPPADKSVEALVKANNARAGTIDYANCRSRLLKALDGGKKVDPKECRK